MRPERSAFAGRSFRSGGVRTVGTGGRIAGAAHRARDSPEIEGSVCVSVAQLDQRHHTTARGTRIRERWRPTAGQRCEGLVRRVPRSRPQLRFVRPQAVRSGAPCDGRARVWQARSRRRCLLAVASGASQTLVLSRTGTRIGRHRPVRSTRFRRARCSSRNATRPTSGASGSSRCWPGHSTSRRSITSGRASCRDLDILRGFMEYRAGDSSSNT